MSKLKGSLIGSIVVLAVLGFAAFSTSRAISHPVTQTSQPDSGQTMQALLGEVRQLRLAIQRSNLNTYHAQVTLERLRLQQQRVDRLTEKLGEARKELATMRRSMAELPEASKKLEAQLARESDANKRRELEGRQELFKSMIESAPENVAKLQETESELSGQLQIEQVKLNELNDRLDTLQKELEVIDKSQQNGKRQ
jgi:Mg2+ and Co2+ transporter CorA